MHMYKHTLSLPPSLSPPLSLSRIHLNKVLYLYRTTSANRSLPDIPKDKNREHEDVIDSVPQDIYETTEIMGDHSELYATVQDAGNIKLIKVQSNIND